MTLLSIQTADVSTTHKDVDLLAIKDRFQESKVASKAWWLAGICVQRKISQTHLCSFWLVSIEEGQPSTRPAHVSALRTLRSVSISK